MSDKSVTVRAPGTACIKSEYLVLDRIRELNINYVANKDRGNIRKCGGNSAEEPSRKKLKGQNKNRPREKRAPKSQKLCFQIGSQGSCAYGDSCCYSHDVDAYLSRKLSDISETCYLFETFGKCPYSFSCRFSLKHIADKQNVTNEKLWNQFKDKQLVVNSLDKDIQKALRKHSYDFSRTQQALKNIEGKSDYQRKQNDVKVSVADCDRRTVSSKVQNESNTLGDKLTDVKCVTDSLPENKTMCEKSNESVQKNSPCLVELCEAADAVNIQNDSVISKSVGMNDPEHVKIPDVDNQNEKKESVDIIQDSKIMAPNKCDVKDVPADNLHNGKQLLDVKSSESKNLSSEIAKGNSLPLPIEEDIIKLKPSEIKKIDFRGKLYLAPLTTVGNLPFRRICKEFGVDITCGEMAMALSLLQGHLSEWALLKRHYTEDIFGVQICGAHSDLMTKCSQLLTETASIDFIDINMGCPLDLVYKKGAGCGLINRLKKFDDIVHCMSSVINVPLTVKMRAGVYANDNCAHNVIKRINKWGDCISLITVHGRSREQRYTKSADWSYINRCAELAHPIPLFGNGDILSYEDYNMRVKETKVSGAMIARGALIKPWIFKEIKEQRHWDISSGERMDMLKNYVNYGLEQWGSDSEGVEKTRRFLLEWLSFLYRYIPVGLLERVPQRINERPPPYHGRNDLETLMASPSCADWIKISEMLLGPVPESFIFLPKHKANAYQ